MKLEKMSYTLVELVQVIVGLSFIGGIFLVIILAARYLWVHA